MGLVACPNTTIHSSLSALSLYHQCMHLPCNTSLSTSPTKIENELSPHFPQTSPIKWHNCSTKTRVLGGPEISYSFAFSADQSLRIHISYKDILPELTNNAKVKHKCKLEGGGWMVGQHWWVVQLGTQWVTSGWCVGALGGGWGRILSWLAGCSSAGIPFYCETNLWRKFRLCCEFGGIAHGSFFPSGCWL